MTTRRNFLATTWLGTLGLPQWQRRPYILGSTHKPPTPSVVPDDATVRMLADRALDAAKSAGATYADVRFTHTRFRNLIGSLITEKLDVGVRALVNDCWGFTSGSLWSPDEAARLGRDAAAQARANALSSQRPIQLPPISVATGQWQTPMAEDAFEVPFHETRDFIQGVLDQIPALISPIPTFRSSILRYNFEAHAQRSTIVSTEGSYFVQTYYATGGLIKGGWGLSELPGKGSGGFELGPVLRQGGWEIITRFPWRDQILQQIADGRARTKRPTKVVEVGRNTVVFTAEAMASLIRATLAPATQLDRALGYEANAGGTSYLGPDPMAFLGKDVAAPIVSLTGERSTSEALATTKWDYEGVVPQPFPIIKNGTLVDYQTTREMATLLDPWYTAQGMPRRSHGCANAEHAGTIAMTHTPNLVLHPGRVENLTLADLIGSVSKGMLVDAADQVTADQQCLNGGGRIAAQEIRGGRIVQNIDDAAILFRAPELWKNISALGGPSSAVLRHSFPDQKGEPVQRTHYGISAVPAIVQDVTIVNAKHRA